jgi:hypothetical protein
MKIARIAFCAGITLAGAPAFAGGLQLAIPNSLLVVDRNNQRVLRVALDDGAVTVFSPPEGAQANLLTSPRGIGVGRDGTIVVANYFENTLVEIDRATGAQFPVEGIFSGPPAIGTGPRDVAVNPRDPAPGFFPTLGVASQGALHQVVRNALDTTGTLLAPYPISYGPYLGNFVVPRLPGNEDPLDYVVATGPIAALLWYDGAADVFTPIWEPLDVDAITGLDAPREGPYALVAAFHKTPCSMQNSGVKLFTTLGETGSGISNTGFCPGPVAYDGRTDTVYVVDADPDPQIVFGIDDPLAVNGPIYSYEHATLPSGASASDMALAYVPEPERATSGAVALGMLASADSARRWRGWRVR